MHSSREVHTATDSGGAGHYSAGQTYWVGASQTPACVLEDLALRLFRRHTSRATFDPERSGAEWCAGWNIEDYSLEVLVASDGTPSGAPMLLGAERAKTRCEEREERCEDASLAGLEHPAGPRYDTPKTATRPLHHC